VHELNAIPDVGKFAHGAFLANIIGANQQTLGDGLLRKRRTDRSEEREEEDGEDCSNAAHGCSPLFTSGLCDYDKLHST
jgi:hypothetical protein